MGTVVFVRTHAKCCWTVKITQILTSNNKCCSADVLMNMDSTRQKHASLFSGRQMKVQTSSAEFLFRRLLLTVWFQIVKLQLMRWDIKQHRFTLCVWVCVTGWRCRGDSGCFTRVKAPLANSRLPHIVTTTTTGSEKLYRKTHSLTVCVCGRCWPYLKPV